MGLNTVGSIAFDTIETPFGKTDKIVGGAAPYIVLSASYFGLDVNNLIAVVGEDFPQDYIDMFKQKGINTEGLEVKEGRNTFAWHGRYHTDMNTRDTLKTELNVLEDFDPKIPDNYQGEDYLMLGNLTPQVQKAVIDRQKSRPKLIALDSMNLWIENENEALKDTIQHIDVLIINDEEARQLSNEYSLRTAARRILEMGPEYLVIKKGEHGALLFHGEEVFNAPGLPLEEVFDPTGAGDTFAGGFMGYLAKTDDTSFENMKRAVIYASTMASFCVEKFGTEQLQNLTDKQVQDRLNQFLKLASVDLKMQPA
jgi:sugar/nucleoside kinase (ribokinase family)